MASSFALAERFPGGDSDDDESSISSEIATSLETSLKESSASSRCSPELGLAGAPAPARSAPQLPSRSPAPERSVQRSVTFYEGQPRLYSRASSALKLVHAATQRAIDASLSVHDVSYYGQMLASSEPLSPGHKQLLVHAESSRDPASPESLCAEIGTPLTARRAESVEPVEPAPLTPGLYAQVFFAVVKSYVGPAILYLPHAFRNGGMLPSLLILPFLGGLTTAALCLLVQCHTCAAGAPTYADMAALALGRPGRLAVTAALVGAQLSTITSYYMFVARSLVGATRG